MVPNGLELDDETPLSTPAQGFASWRTWIGRADSGLSVAMTLRSICFGAGCWSPRPSATGGQRLRPDLLRPLADDCRPCPLPFTSPLSGGRDYIRRRQSTFRWNAHAAC